uniref:Collagen-like protein 2 n=2 Tax=Magallana gigas TaxID=29159 RepID=A0A8W8MVW6_MAGGI
MHMYIPFLVFGAASVLADIHDEIRKISDEMDLVKSEIVSLQEKIRLMRVNEEDLHRIAPGHDRKKRHVFVEFAPRGSPGQPG